MQIVPLTGQTKLVAQVVGEVKYDGHSTFSDSKCKKKKRDGIFTGAPNTPIRVQSDLYNYAIM